MEEERKRAEGRQKKEREAMGREDRAMRQLLQKEARARQVYIYQTTYTSFRETGREGTSHIHQSEIPRREAGINLGLCLAPVCASPWNLRP